MPAKEPTIKPNRWQQQRFGQDFPSPTSSKKTFLEDEPDVDAPKQTRLAASSSSEIKCEEKPEVYASLRTVRSEAINSLLTKMKREDEQCATAAAEGGGAATLRGYDHDSAVLPASLAAWDVYDDGGQHDQNKLPDWNLRFTDKEADQHLTNVELTLRILNEVKDRARKYDVSFMAASPFPRWILGALYEMRLTVAALDVHGEGRLSFFQRHALSSAKVAVRELEDMKGEVERESGVDIWGSIDEFNGAVGPAQGAYKSKDKTTPYGSTKSASTHAPAAGVEEKSGYAKVKREEQAATNTHLDGSRKANGQGQKSPHVKHEEFGSGGQQQPNDDKKSVKPKTLFIGEVNGGIYHFVDTGGEVSCTCRRREPQDPVDIPQFKLTQLMNTLLSHEHAEVRLIGGRMFPNGITAPVDRDGNYIQDWV